MIAFAAGPGASGHAPVAPPAATASCTQRFVRLTGRVVDEAGLLSEVEEHQLSTKLAALEARTGHQVVVATVKTLQGKQIESYSLCLANHWGIGRAKEDDGVVLLVAPVERKVRIEVGYGLETALTDAEAKAILDGRVLPEFRAGKMSKGIQAGVSAIIAEVQ